MLLRLEFNIHQKWKFVNNRRTDVRTILVLIIHCDKNLE